MTGQILVGTILKGFCNGYFGRDSYDTKRVEAVGVDWVVARVVDEGFVVLAVGERVHEELLKSQVPEDGDDAEQETRYGPGIRLTGGDAPKHLFVENGCISNIGVGEDAPPPGEPWEVYLFGHQESPDGKQILVTVEGSTEDEMRDRVDALCERDDVTLIEGDDEEDDDEV